LSFFIKKRKEKQLHHVNGVIQYAPTVTATIVDCLGQLDFVNASNIFLEHFL